MNSVAIVIASLLTHKVRTGLAILGITLGALSFLSVQQISLSLAERTRMETEKFGSNILGVVAGNVRFSHSGNPRGRQDTQTLLPEEIEKAVATVPDILLASPYVENTHSVRAGNTTVVTTVIATAANYPAIRAIKPEYGRYFTAEENVNRDLVCFLGNTIAEKLFVKSEDALGKTVLVGKVALKVVGVMEGKGSDLSGNNQDDQILVPLNTYMRRLANMTWVHGAYFTLNENASKERIQEHIRLLLRKEHKISGSLDDDFTFITQSQAAKMQKQALDIVQLLGLISASLCFGIGGLGILSIMILIIRSRKKEIAIRRTVGARKKDILMQFLLESGFIAFVGGSIGVIASVGVSYTISVLVSFPFVLAPFYITLTLVISVLIGIFAGLYPALEAAQTNIVTTLKHAEE